MQFKRRPRFRANAAEPEAAEWHLDEYTACFPDESRLLLRHSDGRVIIWHKEHESMDPSCLVSMVQAGGGGVMVWGIFLAHFGPLSTN